MVLSAEACKSSPVIKGGPCLLRWAVVGVQNGLIRDIIGASAKVSAGSKVDQLEAPLLFSEDNVLQSEWAVRLCAEAPPSQGRLPCLLNKQTLQGC